MKNRDENAKSPDWQVPTNLPGVAPEDYDASIDSGRGSAHSKGQVISRSGTIAAFPYASRKGAASILHDEEIGGA